MQGESQRRTHAARTPQYAWAQERLRGGRMPEFRVEPVKGYGAAGEYTLYLPSSESKRSIQFDNGVPVVRIVSASIDDELSRLRDLAIVSARPDATINLQLHFDNTIAMYSAAALSRVYDLSDEDLTMLHSGRLWIEPVFVHAMGGKDSVDALARIYARVMSERPIEPSPLRETVVVEESSDLVVPELEDESEVEDWVD